MKEGSLQDEGGIGGAPCVRVCVCVECVFVECVCVWGGSLMEDQQL